jgi:hypothetical protein
MLRGLRTVTARSARWVLNALVSGRATVLGTHRLTRVSQFLALSPVRGSRGHAGDAWFVDLEG